MGSLTSSFPKCLLLVNDKPFIFYILKSIESSSSITSVHFCLGFKSELVLNYLRSNVQFDWTYSVESENSLLGTGGAIRNALPYLDDSFLVQYGDTVLDIDYHSFIKMHQLESRPMTMSALSADIASESPNIRVDCIEESVFIYKKDPPPPKANYIDYGLLAFNKTVFQNIQLPKIFDLSLIQENLSMNNLSSLFIASNKYVEIGTIDSLQNANNEVHGYV